MSVLSRPLRCIFTVLMLPALAVGLAAGCSSTISGPGPVPTSSSVPTPTPMPTPTRMPSGVLLTGAAIKLPFVSQGQAGAILVPPQIHIGANDFANVVAGPSPQASMPAIPLVPGPFYTRPIVYTAVTFTQRTTMEHLLGLTFDLPSSIDPDFGTFFLAVYEGHGWDSIASTHGAAGQTIAFAAAGKPTTYSASAPHGVALYQLADVETPMPVPSPSTVQFTQLGRTAKIDVTEPDYYGSWTAVSSDPSVATVSPAHGGPHFRVTAVKAGKTTIRFTDSAGGVGSVFVGVTTSGGGIH
jgi:hypothetical protein